VRGAHPAALGHPAAIFAAEVSADDGHRPLAVPHQRRGFPKMRFLDLPFALPGDMTSWVALITSFFTLWQTAFKRADIKAFVPPTIRYASPYQNSNFEVFEIPVTVLNQGARTGTVLAMELTVEVAGTGVAKRFYAAGFDQWNLERSRGGAFRPFTPLSLAGRTSRGKTVLFFAREDEKVMQIVERTGDYAFELKLETVLARDNGILARLFERRPKPIKFQLNLPVLDHRAFTAGSGTLRLNQHDYRTSS
jgi:Alpha-2-macroglobulin family